MTLPLLSPSQMAEMDRRTIDDLGVPGLALMESAAGRCVDALLTRWGRLARTLGVHVWAGPGNNGGDGFAIARRLVALGIECGVTLAVPTALSEDCASQRVMAEAHGVLVGEASGALPAAGVYVDALFGTGLRRPIAGALAATVQWLNQQSTPVLCVDIPSGVHGGTGQVLGAAVRGDVTVTFAAAKLGHFIEPGREHRGDLLVADIGASPHFHPDLVTAHLLDGRVLDGLTHGARSAHKGTFGHLLVVAGGPGKVGAARLTCEAALRAGAGLVTLAVPSGIPEDSLAGLRPEVMVERVPCAGGAFDLQSLEPVLALAASRDAVAIGPGVGGAPETAQFVRGLLAACSSPTVIDADGLNAMVGERWPTARAPRVATPHPGEAARLLGRPTAAIQQARVEAVGELASLIGGTAVLKGAGTLVAGPGGLLINPSGNPGMGTAGSGDVLTGVVGALLAGGLDGHWAAGRAVYWHGAAGDHAAATLGERSLLASDIIQALGAVLSRADAEPAARWLTMAPPGWASQ